MRMEIVHGIKKVLEDYDKNHITTSEIIKAVFTLDRNFEYEVLDIGDVKVRVATEEWVEREDCLGGNTNMVDFFKDIPYTYRVTKNFYVAYIEPKEIVSEPTFIAGAEDEEFPF